MPEKENMDARKKKVDAWIEYVIQNWLYSGLGKTTLEGPRAIIKNKMMTYLESENHIDACHCIERLKHLSNGGKAGGSDPERAETLLYCGLGAYKMGEYQDANEFFEKALGLYSPNAHYRGVVLWIIGCVHWLLLSHIDNAILFWEQARISFNSVTNSSVSPWYKDRSEEMRRAIETATLESCPPHPADIVNYIPPKPVSADASSSPRSAGADKRNTLSSFPILGQIPAGMPAEVIKSDRKMYIEEVILDGIPHRIVSLKDSTVLRLAIETYYFVLQVSGHSMDRANPEPIKDKDYVLMRAQANATPGDIVAAEIAGEPAATLKRYATENGKPVLKPESNDTSIPDPISQPGDEIRIRGIALAVLKKIEK
jgi:SOS-response transcriptional repressor LexA